MAEDRGTKRCPVCAEDVWADAKICRFCRYEFSPMDTDAPPTSGTATTLGSSDGEENLSEAIRRAMADGWSPGYADARSAVMYRGTKISHGLHGILSWPFAFGFWYWVYITLRHGGVHQMHLTAQRDGSVEVQEAPEATPRWVYLEWAALAVFQIWFALMMVASAGGRAVTADPYANQGVFLPGTVTAPPASQAPGASAGNPNQGAQAVTTAGAPPPGVIWYGTWDWINNVMATRTDFLPVGQTVSLVATLASQPSQLCTAVRRDGQPVLSPADDIVTVRPIAANIVEVEIAGGYTAPGSFELALVSCDNGQQLAVGTLVVR